MKCLDVVAGVLAPVSSASLASSSLVWFPADRLPQQDPVRSSNAPGPVMNSFPRGHLTPEEGPAEGRYTFSLFHMMFQKYAYIRIVPWELPASVLASCPGWVIHLALTND
ncbi:Hypothetical protein SMAX5B_012329 [Scophthalmus maximus]|uniref:Uncharacterized protein n=1 Tax=Scophthalmus maximus TaxID=52904 RepID=A0A2U9BCE0_SCOMX|nr:Hypothetical protein SMAX5B_012329 [Scophthalmus maximus]